MLKLLLAIFVMFSLTSCTPSYDDNTGDYKLPPELSDCKIYELNANLKNLYVVRCPDSQVTTTTSCGKGCNRSVTIN